MYLFGNGFFFSHVLTLRKLYGFTKNKDVDDQHLYPNFYKLFKILYKILFYSLLNFWKNLENGGYQQHSQSVIVPVIFYKSQEPETYS